MGTDCYLRALSRTDATEIDANPDKAYELILGQKISTGTRDTLVRQEDKSIRQVDELHVRHAATLDRIRKANATGTSVPEELRDEYRKYLNEFRDLTRPWSNRNRTAERSGQSRRVLEIGKAWHGLHFLLTGRSEGGQPPFSLAVLGGKPIPDRHALLGFGPALKLSSEEVTEVSEALDLLSCDDLLGRYDARVMREQNIYAMGQSAGEDREYLSLHYKKLVAFYSKARNADDGMLVYLK